MSDPLTWPDWLADMPDRDRLRNIMAAVHRCYMGHPFTADQGYGHVPDGPHMTISMAENFIAQMLPEGTSDGPR